MNDIQAVIWDFGGVISSSPFEAFARYEAARGLPANFLRTVNATNPHDNAWARLERSEFGVEAFDEAFAAESRALGHEVRGADDHEAGRRPQQAGFDLRHPVAVAFDDE
jgi:putative hydrolase of the HAD superfamily